jgi:hypothetical protein
MLFAVHGFNGLRVILIELKQGPTYEKAVSYGCLAGMVGLIAYGSRTIIMTNEKAVSYGCLAGMVGLIAYGSRTIIMTNMGMV